MTPKLFQKTKEIVIEGVSVTLKKFSLSVSDYFNQKYLEGRKYKFLEKKFTWVDDPEDEKIFKVTWTPEEMADNFAEKVVAGVGKWDLADSETDQLLPVSKSVALELAKNFPDFSEKLLKEVDDFNAGLDDEEKKT